MITRLKEKFYAFQFIVKEKLKGFKSALKSFILGIIIIIAIFIGGGMLKLCFSTAKTMERNPKFYGEKTSFKTAFFSSPPSIRIAENYPPKTFSDLTCINVIVKPQDDCEKITVKIKLYDEEDHIIKQDFITQYDLNEGEEYIFEYNLIENVSTTKIFQIYSVSCELYEYET